VVSAARAREMCTPQGWPVQHVTQSTTARLELCATSQHLPLTHSMPPAHESTSLVTGCANAGSPREHAEEAGCSWAAGGLAWAAVATRRGGRGGVHTCCEGGGGPALRRRGCAPGARELRLQFLLHTCHAAARPLLPCGRQPCSSSPVRARGLPGTPARQIWPAAGTQAVGRGCGVCGGLPPRAGQVQ
jgi:hypothetical protein